jgi:predicted transcriptional regulator
MAKAEVIVTLRISREEVEALDQLTAGQLSRSMVIRTVLTDFLKKSQKAKREFLSQRLFGS